MRHHIGAQSAEERTDHAGRSRRKNRETAGARAPQDPHEHGLRSIFRVVGGGDDGAVRGISQRFPPSFARARLKIAASRYDDLRAGKGHMVLGCHALGEVELSRSLRAEAVVDAVCAQA